ncbi:uncharacterized protein LOC142597365 isoform X2 [Dermatophagoides farinae]|uniref:uncharacterized protein LOC142597365 isoform X2 n=1 Tax=Dermatophagoides farinae TaxID=6954 RepID=UPI003F63AA1A
MSILPKLINDFCFKMDLNETIWPLDISLYNSMPVISSTISWSMSSFQNFAQIEREKVDRNTSCNLRAGLFPNEIFIIYGEQYICSSSYEIYLMLLHYYRCSISFVVSNESYGGYLTSNGSWTGILKLVQQNKIDFIPHMFSMEYNRHQLLDHKQLFPQEHTTTMLTQKHYLINDDPFRLFHAYTLDIWLLILTSFLCFTFLTNSLECLIAINLKEKFCPSMFIVHHSSNRSNQWLRFHHIVNNLIDMFTLFIGQDLPKWKNPVLIRSDHHYHQWGQLKIKTVIKTLQNSLIIWIFSSMILRLLFSLDILALFLSEKEQTIDYFDQLELFLQIHPDYRIILNPNSTTAKNFLENFPKLEQFITPVNNAELTTWETIKKIVDGQHILIIDRGRAQLLENFYENLKLHVSIEGLPVIHGMGIWNLIWRRSIKFNWLQSELSRLQNQWILTINDIETNVKEISEINFKNRILHNNNIGEHSLDTTNTLSLIYIYLLGVGLSIVMFMVEIVYFVING